MGKKASSNYTKKAGLSPGSVIYVGDKASSELYIDVFEYNKDFIEEKELNNVEDAFNYVDSKHITWININGLNHTEAIEKIGSKFKIHPLVLEDIVNTKQRPKFDEYESYFFTVAKMLHFDEKENLYIEHIGFILGKNYVLSFQETDGDVFDPLRERLRSAKGKLRTMGSDYLLYALIDSIVDNYFNLIEVLSTKIEELEDNLFEKKQNDDIAANIQDLKREILRIRKAVFPLREVVNRIQKSDNVLIQDKTRHYYSDVYDHIIQLSENIDLYREMIWGLMDMYMTSISNKMNEVMKVLTIIATIFIPLTFIAGIYGMNFDNIPELKFEKGYFVLLGVMLLIFLGMLFYFKRKKWL